MYHSLFVSNTNILSFILYPSIIKINQLNLTFHSIVSLLLTLLTEVVNDDLPEDVEQS